MGAFITKKTIDLSNEITYTNEKRKQLYAYLTGESTQFNTLCVNEEINSYYCSKQRPQKDSNRIQRMSGFHSTAYTRKEIRFSRCLKKHMDLVKAELIFCNLKYDDRTGIIALKSILKKDEKRIKTEQFLLETNAPPREEDIDEKHLKPRHRPADEWGDAYHAS